MTRALVREHAPAKVNLYLHVGRLRPDRLHDLASLFVFTEEGDILTAEPAPELTLQMCGPFAGPLRSEPVERNLVMRAARLLQQEHQIAAGAKLTLDKRLPIAAGLGGGSADAAAALKALTRLWGVQTAPERLAGLAFALGADVPACLHRTPIEVTGAGERISKARPLPPLWICLVNPRVPMPTGAIFHEFDKAGLYPDALAPVRPSAGGVGSIGEFLLKTRNDLEPFAIRREPVIAQTLAFLAGAPGSIGSRMSGSGATTFGLFTSPVAADRARQRAVQRGWWSTASKIAS